MLAAGVSLTPEASIPLVGDDADPPSLNPLALSKSPKSCDFPVLAMVIKSMLLIKVGDAGISPPAKRPLVAFPNPRTPDLPEVKSPKSCAFP